LTLSLYIFAKLLWLLLVAHILCDFQLQGPSISQAKNHKTATTGLPWQGVMMAHGMIHGAAVILLTGSLMLGAIECVAHMTIDYIKNDGLISFKADQALHVACKVVYAVIIVYAVLQ
jgi:hypothetical protein